MFFQVFFLVVFWSLFWVWVVDLGLVGRSSGCGCLFEENMLIRINGAVCFFVLGFSGCI